MKPTNAEGAVTVSVVVPAHRAEATLGRTLESVRRQTRHDWEVLVVDDGSDDGTLAVARGFAAADRRFRVLRQEHAGVGAARNRGIAHATGVWLHLLDADDLVESGLYESLLRLLATAPELDLLVAGSRTLAPDGTLLVTEEGAIPADLERRVTRTCPFNPCACLVRLARVRAIGGFDPSFRVAGDWDFWRRLVAHGIRAAAVPEILASYCRRRDSLSTDHAAVLRGGLRIILDASGPGAAALAAAIRGASRDAAAAAAIQAGWCAGGLLERQRDVAAALDGLPSLPNVDPAADEVAQALVGGALDSANRRPEAWPDLRRAIGDALDPAVASLARFCAGESFREPLAAALDALTRQLAARTAG